MGSARKKKRVVSDKCSVVMESDVNLNVIKGKDVETSQDLNDDTPEHVSENESCCEVIKMKDHLSILNSSILGYIFTLLDNDDLIKLSTLCRRMRFLVQSMFYLSFKLPMSEEDLESIRQNPYCHNKPVLRLNLTNPVPGNNVTKQLLVLNLARVSEVFIKYDYDEDKDVVEFRIALIALMQILIDFKMVKKLHLQVYPEFFFNQIRVFGRKLMGAMIQVHSIGIALQEHSKMEKNVRSSLYVLEDFISSLTCKNLTLRGSLFFEITKKKVFKVENPSVNVLTLCAPCFLHPRFRLSSLETLSTKCRDCSSPQPPQIDCVVTWKQVLDGCPILKQINGHTVEEVKSRSKIKRQKKKTTSSSTEVDTSPLAVSPPKKKSSDSESECAVPDTVVFAKKSKPQINSAQMMDIDQAELSTPEVQYTTNATQGEILANSDGKSVDTTKPISEIKEAQNEKIIPKPKQKKRRGKFIRRTR